MRAVALSIALLPVLACGPEEVTPDAVYSVRVSSLVENNELVTDCVDEGRVFEQTFRYELFFQGSTVDLKIDGEGFAAGTRSGCGLVYESAVWLEERGSGDVRWQLSGVADYEGAAGGCDDIPDGLDWIGDEVIEVVESEDESVPAGCTYEMVTEGSLSGG